MMENLHKYLFAVGYGTLAYAFFTAKPGSPFHIADRTRKILLLLSLVAATAFALLTPLKTINLGTPTISLTSIVGSALNAVIVTELLRAALRISQWSRQRHYAIVGVIFATFTLVENYGSFLIRKWHQ